MDNLKIQNTVTFELYNCIGIVLKVADGKTFDSAGQYILVFEPESKVVSSRKVVATVSWYAKSSHGNNPPGPQKVYQILIGNHKGWIGEHEIKHVQKGGELV